MAARKEELMRERDIEGKLVELVEKKYRGKCLKFNPDNAKGMPDRLLLLPYGITFWVELKTDDGVLSEAQLYQHRKLDLLGHKVYVIHNAYELHQLDTIMYAHMWAHAER